MTINEFREEDFASQVMNSGSLSSNLPAGVRKRSSSISYTYTGGTNNNLTRADNPRLPHKVEFRSSSVRAKAELGASSDVVIGEARASYRDSTGSEKIGVIRTIGNRGRLIVRGVNQNGHEEPLKDVLINSQSNARDFDSDWERRASAIGGDDYW